MLVTLSNKYVSCVLHGGYRHKDHYDFLSVDGNPAAALAKLRARMQRNQTSPNLTDIHINREASCSSKMRSFCSSVVLAASVYQQRYYLACRVYQTLTGTELDKIAVPLSITDDALMMVLCWISESALIVGGAEGYTPAAIGITEWGGSMLSIEHISVPLTTTGAAQHNAWLTDQARDDDVALRAANSELRAEEAEARASDAEAAADAAETRANDARAAVDAAESASRALVADVAQLKRQLIGHKVAHTALLKKLETATAAGVELTTQLRNANRDSVQAASVHREKLRDAERREAKAVLENDSLKRKLAANAGQYAKGLTEADRRASLARTAMQNKLLALKEQVKQLQAREAALNRLDRSLGKEKTILDADRAAHTNNVDAYNDVVGDLTSEKQKRGDALAELRRINLRVAALKTKVDTAKRTARRASELNKTNKEAAKATIRANEVKIERKRWKMQKRSQKDREKLAAAEAKAAAAHGDVEEVQEEVVAGGRQGKHFSLEDREMFQGYLRDVGGNSAKAQNVIARALRSKSDSKQTNRVPSLSTLKRENGINAVLSLAAVADALHGKDGELVNNDSITSTLSFDAATVGQGARTKKVMGAGVFQSNADDEGLWIPAGFGTPLSGSAVHSKRSVEGIFKRISMAQVPNPTRDRKLEIEGLGPAAAAYRCKNTLTDAALDAQKAAKLLSDEKEKLTKASPLYENSTAAERKAMDEQLEEQLYNECTMHNLQNAMAVIADALTAFEAQHISKGFFQEYVELLGGRVGSWNQFEYAYHKLLFDTDPQYSAWRAFQAFLQKNHPDSLEYYRLVVREVGVRYLGYLENAQAMWYFLPAVRQFLQEEADLKGGYQRFTNRLAKLIYLSVNQVWRTSMVRAAAMMSSFANNVQHQLRYLKNTWDTGIFLRALLQKVDAASRQGGRSVRGSINAKQSLFGDELYTYKTAGADFVVHKGKGTSAAKLQMMVATGVRIGTVATAADELEGGAFLCGAEQVLPVVLYVLPFLDQSLKHYFHRFLEGGYLHPSKLNPRQKGQLKAMPNMTDYLESMHATADQRIGARASHVGVLELTGATAAARLKDGAGNGVGEWYTAMLLSERTQLQSHARSVVGPVMADAKEEQVAAKAHIATARAALYAKEVEKEKKRAQEQAASLKAFRLSNNTADGLDVEVSNAKRTERKDGATVEQRKLCTDKLRIFDKVHGGSTVTDPEDGKLKLLRQVKSTVDQRSILSLNAAAGSATADLPRLLANVRTVISLVGTVSQDEAGIAGFRGAPTDTRVQVELRAHEAIASAERNPLLAAKERGFELQRKRSASVWERNGKRVRLDGDIVGEMKVAVLKGHLQRLGLDATGLKDHLVDRLEQALSS